VARACTGPSDVLVVGGGVIGLAVAWRSAQRGLSVTVLDPDPGRGANRVAAGMLAPVTELQYGEEALLRLGIASNQRYAAFAAELTGATGLDLGYRACGTLAVALDADDRAELRELHAFQQRLGLDAQWLTGRECRRLEPMLAPSVRGGLLVSGDHQVDGRRLGTALVAACAAVGVELYRSRAAELTVRAGRATGVLVEDGTLLTAGQTVLAAGSWSGELPGVPEQARLPVRPVKGQILRLRMESHFGEPFLSRNVRALVRGGHLYLVPRANGELVVGATPRSRASTPRSPPGASGSCSATRTNWCPGSPSCRCWRAARGCVRGPRTTRRCSARRRCPVWWPRPATTATACCSPRSPPTPWPST
jgi:glycine oxidase